MWVFLVEAVAAAAVPLRPGPDAPGHRSDRFRATATVVVGDRTVRLTGPGERLLSRVASNVGAAVRRVEAFWGADWPREISVVGTGSDEQFRAAAGGGPAAQWADIAAVTVADRVDPAHRVTVGQRIVFAPGAADMSEPALRIVLTHELFHYAARRDTALDAPRWLTEAVADFVARPITPVPAAAVPEALALPSDAELDTPGPRRSSAYDRAWWFARFVADSYGAATLRAFYAATCGARHADLPAAIRDVLGVDPAGLVVRWGRWLSAAGEAEGPPR